MIAQTIITEESASVFLKGHQSSNLEFQKVTNSENMLLFTQLVTKY